MSNKSYRKQLQDSFYKVEMLKLASEQNE